MTKIIFRTCFFIFLFFTSYIAQAQQAVPISTVLTQSASKVDKKVTLELFNYEDNLYSRSQKATLGDFVQLRTRFRYQFNENAWASVGFTTVPTENRFDNKTSDFELRTGYSYGDLNLQLDMSLNTDDDDGGITFGPDLDSRDSFLSYNLNKKSKVIFYPFNFNSATGIRLENGRASDIYFIDGTPTNLNTNQTNDERLARKTIPGFEFNYSNLDENKKGYSFYLGGGLASYLYPSDPSFDIRRNVGSIEWERKEDIGYKTGATYSDFRKFLSIQYSGHTEDFETGSLLKSSLGAYALMQPTSKLIFDLELSVSEAGERAYRVDRRNDWFEVNENISVDPRQRVYSDRQNNLQDWLGKTGYAAIARLGTPIKLSEKKSYTPYLSLGFFDKNFVYDDDLSVHNLRDKNQSLGHGGLITAGLGAYIYNGNFIINPQFEYYKAKNDVFTNSSDITNDALTATFNSNDFRFLIEVTYFYDKKTGPRTFRLN